MWLTGVRRVGKTVLCRSLPGVEYFDCELPSARRALADPEVFLGSMRGKRVVLDEIHRLDDPSELLKIAADHYADVHVVATGSSTLSASVKFRDTLTGRKADVRLTPMISADLVDFEITDTINRLWRGGLPPFFLGETTEHDYQDWMDSYWAREVQELFRIELRSAFLKFVELLLVNSGGMFEATKYASATEVSRTTIKNYLAVLEATSVVTVVRPFGERRVNEIVAAPKVYAFDTGFVRYYRGWEQPRPDDLGPLWEHYVLNEMMARLPQAQIAYWRHKQSGEVDFVIVRRGRPPVAVECKWNAENAGDLGGMRAFRRSYPDGEDFVVAGNVERPFSRALDGRTVSVVGLEELVKRLGG